MFNNKTYYEVNREERFYCALYAHSLLHSLNIRKNLCKLIENEYDLHLDPQDFEIYLEVAALRDYWNDLGDPKKYTDETHLKRLSVLKKIFQDQGIPEYIISEHGFFWTNGNPKKLWSPGHWSNEGIKATGLDALQKIKWAFNAKPDILIISKSICLFIEAKIESGISQYDGEGSNQLNTQELVSRLLKLLVPFFQEKEFTNILLTKDGHNGISWTNILETLEENDIDSFTWRCFSQLKKYNN